MEDKRSSDGSIAKGFATRNAPGQQMSIRWWKTNTFPSGISDGNLKATLDGDIDLTDAESFSVILGSYLPIQVSTHCYGLPPLSCQPATHGRTPTPAKSVIVTPSPPPVTHYVHAYPGANREDDASESARRQRVDLPQGARSRHLCDRRWPS